MKNIQIRNARCSLSIESQTTIAILILFQLDQIPTTRPKNKKKLTQLTAFPMEIAESFPEDA